MKKLAIRYLSAFALVCLAATIVVCLNHGLRTTFHRELEHRLADARTVMAAARYLATPEVDSPAPAAPREFTTTNFPKMKTAARSANQAWPAATNLPDLTVSNRVVTTQTDLTTPS